MSAALTRRGALRGSLAASLGLAVGVAPALAGSVAVEPDAALIEFANRVASLERRCNTLAGRRATIEDRVVTLLGFRAKTPPEPPSTSRVKTVDDRTTATHRVLTISWLLVEDPAAAEWRAAKTAAEAAYKCDREALETRLGLPEVERRLERSWGRLQRWHVQLAEMRPQTLAGLAAKARPLAAHGEATSIRGSWGQVDEYAHGLAISLAQDAVRLHAVGGLV